MISYRDRGGIAGQMTYLNAQGSMLPAAARLHLLENIVIHANDAVMVTDAEPVEYPGPCIIYVNPAFTAMSGYSYEDAIGQSPRMLHGPLTGTEVPAQIRLALDTWQPIVVEVLNYHKDGTTFWAELSISPLADEKGWFTHWISLQRDVTARKRQEAALRSTRAELEHVLAERTSALAQRDLLLQEVYHRVKNNLQVVDSLLIMQSRSLDDARSKRALQDLRGRIQALSLVHEQLMESADLKTFDIVPFLERLSKNIFDGGGKEGVSIEVKTCTLQIGLDFAVPLGLLVTELVTNALKHAAFPDHKGRILVALDDDTRGELCLTVSDNGEGHYNGNGAAGNGAKAGMGTSIIKSLVAQLEGSIAVEINGGTTTKIRMPMPGAP